MPTQKKSEQIAKIKTAVDSAGAVYVADLSSVKAVEMTAIRRKLKRDKIRVLVVKNRLAKRAMVEAGIPADLAALMRGPTSLVLGIKDEPFAAARLLREFRQKNKEWKFKGAYIEQALYTAEQFDVLATMPTKPELRAQLVGVLSSPIYGLVGVLEGLLNSFVSALDEIKTKRAEAPAGPAASESAPAVATEPAAEKKA